MFVGTLSDDIIPSSIPLKELLFHAFPLSNRGKRNSWATKKKEKKTYYYFPLYLLVNKDPYNGLV